jgi:hypothetical protein
MFDSRMEFSIDGNEQTCGTIDNKYYEAESSGSLAERLAILARNRICQARDSVVLSALRRFLTSVFPTLLERRPMSLNVCYSFCNRVTAQGSDPEINSEGLSRALDFSRLPPTGPCHSLIDHWVSPLPAQQLNMSGSLKNQCRFYWPTMRVGRCVFLTVPFRYFPIRYRTGLTSLSRWHAVSLRRPGAGRRNSS